MGCGITTIKYLLFLGNLIFALAGLAVAGLGGYTLYHLKNVSSESNGGNLVTFPVLFIILGSIVFIIAFFGCCGAIRESHCMVITYFIFLLILIIINVAIGVLLFVYRDDFKTIFTEAARTLFEKKISGNDPAADETYNVLQEFLHCCGLNGGEDYHTPGLPSSCCAKDASYCTSAYAYPGCLRVGRESVDKYGKSAGIIMFVVAGVEAVIGIFSLCLANAIRNAERRSNY